MDGMKSKLFERQKVIFATMTAVRLIFFLLSVFFAFLFIWSFMPLDGSPQHPALLYTGAGGLMACLILIFVLKQQRNS